MLAAALVSSFLLAAAAGAPKSSSADELRETPPASASTTGELDLTCQPSACRVFVDDKAIGTTPLQAKLAPGKHLLRLEDVVTGLKLNKEIEIRAGEILSIDQKTKAPPPPPTPPTTTPATAPTTPTAPATAPTTPTTPATAPTPPAATASLDDEQRDIATLQLIEARLSVAEPPTDAEVATLLRILTSSPAPRARAMAAAVLPWLDPSVSAPPLLKSTRDEDPRVRATAAQSLVALARRLNEADKGDAVAAALSLLDDKDDEAACAGSELVAALNPPNAQGAITVRTARDISSVRYACFARVAGLQPRTVIMPPLPPDPDAPVAVAPTTPTTPTKPNPTTSEPAQQWLFVTTAAGVGFLAGGALPGAIVPARDVLLYDDTVSKLSREEASFATTAGAAIAGAAIVGGAAFGTELLLGPLSTTEATSTLGGAGAGTAIGAGLGLMLGSDSGGQSLALTLGSLGGFAGSAAVAYGFDLTDNDNALMASAMAMGALASTLGTFAAVPVGLREIGAAQRSDFGLGAGMTGAGAFGLVALAAAPFTEIDSRRAGAVVAGGFLGGGLLTGLGFLVVPQDLDVGSRVACGLGLAGQVVGMTLAYVLLPDSWLGISGSVVDVDAKEARFGLPTPIVMIPMPGSSEVPVGVSLVSARF